MREPRNASSIEYKIAWSLWFCLLLLYFLLNKIFKQNTMTVISRDDISQLEKWND
jgi:hypothetical protein